MPSELITACSDGNFEEVSRLIDGGADVDVTDRKGRTLLYLAAMCGQVNALKGASKNSKISHLPIVLSC